MKILRRSGAILSVKREKRPVDESKVPTIAGVSSVGNGSMETGKGTDQIGVQKDGPAKVRLIKNKEKDRQE